MPHPVTAYLDDIRASLGVDVPETSGYPTLRNVLLGWSRPAGNQSVEWVDFSLDRLAFKPLLTGNWAAERRAKIRQIHKNLAQRYPSVYLTDKPKTGIEFWPVK
ncbi:MAG: hypothetical protein V4675_22415 [Verrucomicrobiota bacterium]